MASSKKCLEESRLGLRSGRGGDFAGTKSSLMHFNATQFCYFELSFILRMHIIFLVTSNFSKTFEISSLYNVLELLTSASKSGIHKILEEVRNPKITMTQDVCWETGQFSLA